MAAHPLAKRAALGVTRGWAVMAVALEFVLEAALRWGWLVRAGWWVEALALRAAVWVAAAVSAAWVTPS